MELTGGDRTIYYDGEYLNGIAVVDVSGDLNCRTSGNNISVISCPRHNILQGDFLIISTSLVPG